MLKKAILAVGLLTIAVSAKNVTIRPAEPTHYFYTPKANVNPPNHMVIGLHEFSYAFPGNMQLQASVVDNVGRINLGAKFGLADNLSIGGGLASSFVEFGPHGIHANDKRLGLFLSYGVMQSGNMEMVITPHTQIGDRISLGLDLGMMFTPIDVWSFIWEIGSSVDTHENDGGLYLQTIGGFRIHPPAIPFLNFDIGVEIEEFNVEHDPNVGAFLDIIFSFIAM